MFWRRGIYLLHFNPRTGAGTALVDGHAFEVVKRADGWTLPRGAKLPRSLARALSRALTDWERGQ